MSHPLSRLIYVLALALYLLAGIAPRGVALCFDGEHAGEELVAAHCHHSEGAVPGCTGCVHHHDEHDSPCRDVPLNQDEARIRSGDELAFKLWSARHAAPAPIDMFVEPESATTGLAAPGVPSRDRAVCCTQVAAALRAVIQLI